MRGTDGQLARRGRRRRPDEALPDQRADHARLLNRLLVTPDGWASAVARSDGGLRAQAVTALQRQAGNGAAAATVQRQPAPDPWDASASVPSGGTAGTGTAGAGTAGTGAAGATGAPGAAGSDTPGPVITAEKVSDAEFAELTGMPADTLPEGAMIRDLAAMSAAVKGAPPDLLPPGVAPDNTARDMATGHRDLNSAVAGAAISTPSPVSLVPANSTGIMWVQGHLSIFAKVNGELTIRGFRGNLAYYTGEMLPGAAGRWFSQKLNIGVPGGFVNDLAFTKMPGKQTAIYVATDADTAEAFRDELNATKFNEPYKYSAPRPEAKPGGKEWRMRQFLIAKGGEAMAVQCGNNCITVPVAQIEAAVGMRPQVTTPGGQLDLTTGRTGEGPVDPHAKGRASHMRDYVDKPDLSKAKPGAERISMTEGAVKAMGAIRVAGGLYMIYGGIESVGRLMDAWGTEEFVQTAAEEAGSWGGGLAGGELGGGLAAAFGESVLYVGGGEMSATFVLGSAGFALLLGYAGAVAGAHLVRAIFDAPQVMIQGTTMFLEGLMDVTVAGGKVVNAFQMDLMLRPMLVIHEQVNPGNWDLRGLPPDAANAVHNLGMAAWSTLGAMTADELRVSYGKTFAQLGVPPPVAAEVARSFVPAGILITGDVILSKSPLEFVQYLHKARGLEYVQDPEVLADNATKDGGYKPDEQYLNVRLRPLVETRARINPNNWDLRGVNPGAGAGDVRTVGEVYWRQLRTLNKDEFGPANSKTMAGYGVTPELMRKAAKAMLKSKVLSGQQVAGEEVPADVVEDYARQLLEATPEDFVYQLTDSAGMVFRSDPAGIANAALHWVRAGYQPW